PSEEGRIATSAAKAARADNDDRRNASSPNANGVSGLERLRQRARSIFEHHLHLLSIDYAYDVPVSKFSVSNQLAGVEGLRGLVRLEGGDGLTQNGLLPGRLALSFLLCRRRPTR